jgi:hypothetical protein
MTSSRHHLFEMLSLSVIAVVAIFQEPCVDGSLLYILTRYYLVGCQQQQAYACAGSHER